MNSFKASRATDREALVVQDTSQVCSYILDDEV